MAPRTVCFDLDSTLCRSTQRDADLHAAVFDRVGTEPFCDLDTIYAAGQDVGHAESDHEYFRRLFERAAARVDAGPVDADALATATLDLKDHTAVEWRPGARDALAAAREHAQVGLVTNGSRETQRTKLDVLDASDAFEAVVFAGDDTPPKPSPEPFHAALDALDATPETSVYVGNDYAADVVGAKRAGLTACWVPSATEPTPPADAEHDPDHVFDSPAVVETLF